MKKKYYDILGIDEKATLEDIKKAYRKRAMQLHPDKGGDEKDMKLLAEAYSVLSNPLLRREHEEKEDSEDDEKSTETEIAGLITSDSEPFSQKFRVQHGSLIHEYQETPLNKGSNKHCFKPYRSSIFTRATVGRNRGSRIDEKESGDLLAAPSLLSLQMVQKGSGVTILPLQKESDGLFSTPSLFSHIAQKDSGITLTASPLKLAGPLTPVDAVEIFTHFIRGDYFSDNLVTVREYLTTEIRSLKAAQPNSMHLPLYEGILEVVSMTNVVKGQETQLLFALKKITDYAAITAVETMIFFAPLFQSKHFRDIFSYALHLYWQAEIEVLSPEDLQAFDGESTAKTLGIRALRQFEKDIHEKTEAASAASDYREIAFHILDWMPALYYTVPSSVIVNTYIRIGTYFQRAAAKESMPELQMADETLAASMFMHAFHAKDRATPDIMLYACVQSLKYIAAFKFQHPYFAENIQAFQHQALRIADVFPFFHPHQSNLSLATNSHLSIYLMRQFLHALMEIIELNRSRTIQIAIDHSQVTVLYHAYEACLHNWYEAQHSSVQERKLRFELMQALLAENQWTIVDLSQNLDDPFLMIDRDEQGWMRPTRTLPIPANPTIDKFRSVDGVEIDEETGEVSFLLRAWEDNDVPYEKLLTIYDLNEMLARNVRATFFSLDPVDPDKPYHPFNLMRFAPSSIYETQLLHTMLLTDYLLKFFTVRQVVQGRPPYDVRPLDQLLQNLPGYLRKIIDNFQETQQAASMHRFWIEAEEVPVASEKEGNIRRIAVGDVKMVVKKHRLMRDMHGHLIDRNEAGEGWELYILTEQQKQKLVERLLKKEMRGPAIIFIKDESQQNKVYFIEKDELSPAFVVQIYDAQWSQLLACDCKNGKVIVTSSNSALVYRITKTVCQQASMPNLFSPEYIFAQEFTSHYNEFAQYFPEFGRLRELCRITVLLREINELRRANQLPIRTYRAFLEDSHDDIMRLALAHEANSVDEDDDEKKEDSDTEEQDAEARKKSQEKVMEKRVQAGRRRLQRKYAGMYLHNYPIVNRQLTGLAEADAKDAAVRINKAELYQEQRTRWQSIRQNIGTLYFDRNSPEIGKIAQERLEDVRAQLRYRSLDYYQIQQIESDARRKIDAMKDEDAAELSRRKREECRRQLHEMILPKFSHVPNINWTIERFLDGEQGALDSLARIHADAIYDEILNKRAENRRKDLDAIRAEHFPFYNMIQFEQAIQNPDLYAERVAKSYCNAMKSKIGAELRGLEQVEAHFVEMGLGRQEDEINLAGKCLWVPANIKHDVGSGSSQLVYGGVSLQPTIRILSSNDPMNERILGEAFDGPNQAKIDTKYIADSRRATAEFQGGTEKVGFLYHLRLIEAVSRKMQEAEARGVDLDAVRAGKKASEAMRPQPQQSQPQPQSHPQQGAAEVKQGPTPPPTAAAGGRKPPSPPSSPRNRAANGGAESKQSSSMPNPNRPPSPKFWQERSGNVQTLDPSVIRFSQSSVNNVDLVTESMRARGWQGSPIDVVRMSDGSLVTIDNTRLLAASRANISVKAIIHEANEALNTEQIERFTTKKGGAPSTWEGAALNRINEQNLQYRNTYPQGSGVTGAKK